MRSGTAFRGQPLVLMALLLAGWLAIRVAVWQSPPTMAEPALASAGRLGLPPPRTEVRRGASRWSQPAHQGEADTGADAASPGRGAQTQSQPRQRWLQRPLPEALPTRPGWERLPLLPSILPPQPPAPGAARPVEPAQPAPHAARTESEAGNATVLRRANVRGVVGHNLLLMAGLSQMELPDELIAALQEGPLPPPALARRSAGAGLVEAAPAPAGAVPHRPAVGHSRWTADAWLLLREDTDAPLLSGRGAYGRSQAGAVLRYRLAPGSRHAPQAYLRGSVALDDPDNDLRQSEVAAGLSARPIPALPVRVAAEARVSDTQRGARVRPAVYAVTELDPVPLPLGARGELYLQGGYVAGDDFDTAFIDGQARIERPLARSGPAEFSAGAAVWGGAQENASRLDVGPSAAVSVNLGRLRGRLTADYRFRVAGESRPASGPALTIYAGF